jgi:CRP-like cAMP-binding protein
VIRLACGLALVALALLVAMLANTEASTAISFSFIAHPALALAIGLYVYLTWGPVRMSDDEQELYELSFSALGRRDFVQLAASGRWEDIPAGEKLFRVGDRVDSVWVLLRGVIAAEVDGERLGELGPGGSAGTTMIVTREPSPIDAIAIEPCRALVWHVETVMRLLEKKPNVRAALQGAVSLDLARKVQALTKR